MKVIASIVQRM